MTFPRVPCVWTEARDWRLRADGTWAEAPCPLPSPSPEARALCGWITGGGGRVSHGGGGAASQEELPDLH